MRHLLNTLYVTSEDVYLSLEGENIVASRNGEKLSRYPIHGISDIITFSYAGASPALMGKCAEMSIGLSFCKQNGRFLARISGCNNGNVLLRREQYRIADDKSRSSSIANLMIFGKVFNSRWVLERCLRDHGEKVDCDNVKNMSNEILSYLSKIRHISSLDELRGIEGHCSSLYFSAFDDLILVDKDIFYFKNRSKRPPLDKVNALLSFAYSMLASKCSSALESVGLDSYVGFLHQDRPGRYSLALDLMEELRAPLADRLVLTLINNRIIKNKHFDVLENGSVYLNDDGRKVFLKSWQERQQKEIVHPYLKEKIRWGLVPYVQSLLLARHIRGDIDKYPPFLWK